ncbi:unnamed protein product [Paramecium octaurelia]|uniref:Uncharacterized protein n=1 Tax=Paramecium octaurelia TaxID=43137 RepID=A0A8S1T1Q4_PAROT|nr:unnamed protein product [Paramecium octaurelia]
MRMTNSQSVKNAINLVEVVQDQVLMIVQVVIIPLKYKMETVMSLQL